MEKTRDMTRDDKLIRISIIEDNRYLRAAWLGTLKKVPDFILLGDYSSCEAAFRSSNIGESDVILMDIGLPGMSGIEGVRYLAQHDPKIAIIICTVYDEDEKIFEALCAGAIGYMLKIPAPDLVNAIREANTGGSPMTPNIARKVIASFQKPAAKAENKQTELTEREREVLTHLTQGKSYVAIGKEVFLSVDGVRYHIRHIYEKLQVHTRAEAVAKGLKDRIIQPPQ